MWEEAIFPDRDEMDVVRGLALVSGCVLRWGIRYDEQVRNRSDTWSRRQIPKMNISFGEKLCLLPHLYANTPVALLGSMIQCGKPRRPLTLFLFFAIISAASSFYLSSCSRAHPITTFSSSGNSYSGTARFSGAGPFLARPEMS